MWNVSYHMNILLYKCVVYVQALSNERCAIPNCRLIGSKTDSQHVGGWVWWMFCCRQLFTNLAGFSVVGVGVFIPHKRTFRLIRESKSFVEFVGILCVYCVWAWCVSLNRIWSIRQHNGKSWYSRKCCQKCRVSFFRLCMICHPSSSSIGVYFFRDIHMWCIYISIRCIYNIIYVGM